MNEEHNIEVTIPLAYEKVLKEIWKEDNAAIIAAFDVSKCVDVSHETNAVEALEIGNIVETLLFLSCDLATFPSGFLFAGSNEKIPLIEIGLERADILKSTRFFLGKGLAHRSRIASPYFKAVAVLHGVLKDQVRAYLGEGPAKEPLPEHSEALLRITLAEKILTCYQLGVFAEA